MSTDQAPQGMPAVLAAYLPSTHDVRSLDDLTEIFLTTRSRILAESNSREMDFIDQEKQFRSAYEYSISEKEKHQMIQSRESAIRSLHSDRDSYKEEVQTRLLMLGLWLRDKRNWFIEQEKKKLLSKSADGEAEP